MFKVIVSSALALGMFGIFGTTSQAAPVASGAIGIERLAPGSVEETTYRRYRHHRNYSYRNYGYRNHGYRNYGYRSYSRPGIYLNFGGYGGRRHW